MNPPLAPILLLAVGFALGAARGAPPGVAPVDSGPNSLYERLGGRVVVDAIANELIDRVLADSKLKRSFADTNIPRLRRLLAEQLCSLAHGPCEYSGDTMRDVHAGHHISEAEFYGMVEQLRATLNGHHVPLRERNELLALLAPMERDIVEDARQARAASH